MAEWSWRWVIALGSLVAVAYGTLFYATSILITEEAAGSVFSKTTLSSAYGASVLVSGLLAYWVGRSADRRGIRHLSAIGTVLGSSGLLVLAGAQQPWHVAAAFVAFVGPAGALTFYEPAFVFADQWFGARHRARSVAALTLIGGIAGPVFLPVTGLLVTNMGWRTTAAILAGVFFAAGVATVVTLPSGRPPVAAVGSEAPPPHRAHRSWQFVLYTIAVMLMFGALQAIFLHRIAIFEEAGQAITTVAPWAAASSLISLPGRFGAPYLARRQGAARVQVGGLVLLAAAVLIAVSPGPYWQMSLHFLLFGACFGAVFPLRAYLMSEWFSGPSYGRLMGAQWGLASVAGALGPALAGVIHDRSGDYGPVMIGTAAVLVASAALVAVSAGQRRGSAPSTRGDPRS
jgi:MFS family permease